MKKGIVSFFLSFLLCIAFPFLVYGEETKKSSPDLLSATGTTLENTISSTVEAVAGSTGEILAGATKSVDKTAGDTADFVEQTVEHVKDPIQSKAVSSTVKNAGELAGKVVNNTVPAVKATVKGTTEVTGKIITEAETAVETETNALPQVPEVTPVVKETTKALTKVTGAVKKTVSKTGEAVNGTIDSVEAVSDEVVDSTTDILDQVANLPAPEKTPIKPATPNLQPTKEEVSEPIAEEVVSLPAKPDEANEIEPVESVETERPAAIEIAPINGPQEEAEISEPLPQAAASLNEVAGSKKRTEKVAEPVMDSPSYQDTEAVHYEKKQYSVQENEQMQKNNEAPSSDKKEMLKADSLKDGIGPEPAQQAVTVAPSAPVNGGLSFSTGFSNTIFGMLTAIELTQAPIEKITYFKNSYAVIEWFHTPLGKPPKTSPFFNVM